MKLLFDQNVSPRLADHLSDVFPGSVHVSGVGLECATDRALWRHARQNELAIVTKDADFSEMSLLQGFPPNVVWIRRGNCSTQEIEDLLRHNREAVEHLQENPESGVVELY